MSAAGGLAPQTLVILGATGDLTTRLLLPGLGGLLAQGGMSGLSLVGSAGDAWDDERWRMQVADSFAAAGTTGPDVEAVAQSARYVRADATSQDDLRELLGACRGRPVIYFALPPAVTEESCRALTNVELPPDTRLVMEKPFGTDAVNAEELNRLLTRLVPEDRVHRVDHFLGMSTVLNILGLRFANRIVEPVLSGQHVASVEVIFDESLGLEGRAGYYDSTGALVDMIQSHLLQVLALVAMEAPPTLEAGDVRDAKGQVLRATRVWDDDPVAFSRRARYTAGEVDGRRLPSYVDEEGVDPARETETFAEIVLAIDTWRWAGVPFRVRSGKAIGDPRAEVVIAFREPQWMPTGLSGHPRADRLRIGIGLGPDRLGIDLNISGEDDPFELDPVTLEAEFAAGELPPYGQVLKGILAGERSFTVRGDTAVECWRIVEPVQRAWRADEVPLGEYEAGSDGPAGWPPYGMSESSW